MQPLIGLHILRNPCPEEPFQCVWSSGQLITLQMSQTTTNHNFSCKPCWWCIMNTRCNCFLSWVKPSVRNHWCVLWINCVCALFVSVVRAAFLLSHYLVKVHGEVQTTKCITPTLFLSQATEQEWETASTHLLGNSIHGAQCPWVDGQLRGECRDGDT